MRSRGAEDCVEVDQVLRGERSVRNPKPGSVIFGDGSGLVEDSMAERCFYLIPHSVSQGVATPTRYCVVTNAFPSIGPVGAKIFFLF